MQRTNAGASSLRTTSSHGRVYASSRWRIGRSPKDEKDFSPDKTEKELVFVGLMAMMDPPRDEVATAVEECATAGIEVIMITGDYGLTAESIARRIGIIKGDHARIITGNDLNDMTDDEDSQLPSTPRTCSSPACHRNTRCESRSCSRAWGTSSP